MPLLGFSWPASQAQGLTKTLPASALFGRLPLMPLYLLPTQEHLEALPSAPFQRQQEERSGPRGFQAKRMTLSACGRNALATDMPPQPVDPRAPSAPKPRHAARNSTARGHPPAVCHAVCHAPSSPRLHQARPPVLNHRTSCRNLRAYSKFIIRSAIERDFINLFRSKFIIYLKPHLCQKCVPRLLRSFPQKALVSGSPLKSARFRLCMWRGRACMTWHGVAWHGMASA